MRFQDPNISAAVTLLNWLKLYLRNAIKLISAYRENFTANYTSKPTGIRQPR